MKYFGIVILMENTFGNDVHVIRDHYQKLFGKQKFNGKSSKKEENESSEGENENEIEKGDYPFPKGLGIRRFQELRGSINPSVEDIKILTKILIDSSSK